jgi:transcriptional regulator with XRE-family HTH domain
MATAEVIKQLRMALCLEQKELAALIGISASSISHYEAHVRMPKMSTIRKLLELAKKNKIKISVEDFYE